MRLVFFSKNRPLQIWSILSKILAALVIISASSQLLAQEEETGPRYAYIALDPDIVTNYAGDNSKKLGYLRLAIEMMLVDPDHIAEIEHHMPLLRATAIEVVGAQNEQKVRSLTGREEMRREILNKFKGLLMRETGNEMIKDIIFTKYLRQGG